MSLAGFPESTQGESDQADPQEDQRPRLVPAPQDHSAARTRLPGGRRDNEQDDGQDQSAYAEPWRTISQVVPQGDLLS